MAEKASLNETMPPKNAAHSINPKIDSLLDKVDQAIVRVEGDLKNLLLDFKEHLMRFKEGLELLTLFPEQKYWSLHARNLAYSTQYLAEHLGLIQAQIENVYLRTHHLEDYCQEFEWQKHIGKQATSQIVQHNYLKYLDYPYQTSPIDERLTKSLNDLYQYSCLEEGYMPHYAKQLEPKKIVSSLFKIQEETFQALEKLSKHVFQQLESPIS